VRGESRLGRHLLPRAAARARHADEEAEEGLGGRRRLRVAHARLRAGLGCRGLELELLLLRLVRRCPLAPELELELLLQLLVQGLLLRGEEPCGWSHQLGCAVLLLLLLMLVAARAIDGDRMHALLLVGVLRAPLLLPLTLTLVLLRRCERARRRAWAPGPRAATAAAERNARAERSRGEGGHRASLGLVRQR
jgi:hypothetical protein